MTFTYPLINCARRVVFTVNGAEKAASLAEVLEGKPNLNQYPSQGVLPDPGSVCSLVDAAAAHLLDASRYGASPP